MGGLAVAIFNKIYCLIRHESDTASDKHKKLVLTFVGCFAVVGTLLFVSNASYYESDFGVGVGLVSAFLYISMGIYLSITKKLSTGFIFVFMLVAIPTIGIVDLLKAAVFDRWWTLYIIATDLIVVLRAPTWMHRSVAVSSTFSIAFVQIALSTRFGLLDIPGSIPQDRRVIPQDCDKLPCPSLLELQGMVTRIAIFLINYFFMCGFARQVEREKARVEASVRAAQSVAVSLATFDLEAAEAAINMTACDMPPDLVESLRTILGLLDNYKPYLPQGVLASPRTADRRANSAKAPTFPPPGEGLSDPCAAVVFTDIKGSTLLWEECPKAMEKGVALHNRLVRAILADHGGYEVKTIGDSFMVAFTTMLDAVQFGLDVQTGLHEAEWPAELMEHINCGPSEGWPGLRVRIGAHYGPVTMDYNPLTERMDYMGPTVNRAARLEQAGALGAVTILESVYDAAAWEPALRGVVRRKVEGAVLRGVRGQFTLVGLRHRRLARGGGWCEGLASHAATAGVGSGSECSTASSPASLTSGAAAGTTAAAAAAAAHECVKDVVESPRSSAPGSATSSVDSTVVSMASSMGQLLESRRVVPTRCTVGLLVFRAPAYDESHWSRLQQRFLSVAHWLRRTDGTIASVCGLIAFASWGLLRRASMQVMKAFRFAELLQLHVPRASSYAVTCGLSTGMVSGCHVGDWETRFLAYGGVCVNLCSGLCSLAQRLQADVLYATEGGDRGGGGGTAVAHPALRPVGWLDLAGSTVVAHEVSGRRADLPCARKGTYGSAAGGSAGKMAAAAAAAAARVAGGGGVGDDNTEESEDVEETSWGWTKEYRQLFLEGDVETIVHRAAEASDTVLMNMCRAWDRGGVLHSRGGASESLSSSLLQLQPQASDSTASASVVAFHMYARQSVPRKVAVASSGGGGGGGGDRRASILSTPGSETVTPSATPLTWNLP